MNKSLLSMKDETVDYTVHPVLVWAEPVILSFYAGVGLTPVVTCAKGGKHSDSSRHFWKPGDARPSQALDLRTWSIQDPGMFFRRLVKLLNKLCREDRFAIERGSFVALLEKDHVHLEWNPDGVLPNLKSFTLGQDFYIARNPA